MGSLYQSQANNEESDRKHVTKPNRSQFPVQSRPLTLQGLTKALEDEEKLVDEFQVDVIVVYKFDKELILRVEF